MKKQTIKRAAALSSGCGGHALAASALSWKDGAPANYNFTYGGDNGGIAKVEASDTNGTFQRYGRGWSDHYHPDRYHRVAGQLHQCDHLHRHHRARL